MLFWISVLYPDTLPKWTGGHRAEISKHIETAQSMSFGSLKSQNRPLFPRFWYLESERVGRHETKTLQKGIVSARFYEIYSRPPTSRKDHPLLLPCRVSFIFILNFFSIQIQQLQRIVLDIPVAHARKFESTLAHMFCMTRKGSFKINVRGHFDSLEFFCPPPSYPPSTLDILMTVLYRTETLWEKTDINSNFQDRRDPPTHSRKMTGGHYFWKISKELEYRSVPLSRNIKTTLDHKKLVPHFQFPQFCFLNLLIVRPLSGRVIIKKLK